MFNAASHGLASADLYVMGADYEMRGLAPGLNYFVRVKVSHEKAGVGNTTIPSTGSLPVLPLYT